MSTQLVIITRLNGNQLISLALIFVGYEPAMLMQSLVLKRHFWKSFFQFCTLIYRVTQNRIYALWNRLWNSLPFISISERNSLEALKLNNSSLPTLHQLQRKYNQYNHFSVLQQLNFCRLTSNQNITISDHFKRPLLYIPKNSKPFPQIQRHDSRLWIMVKLNPRIVSIGGINNTLQIITFKYISPIK